MLTYFTNLIRDYLAKTRKTDIFLALLFFLSAIFGYVLTENSPDEIQKFFIEKLNDMFEPALNLPPLKLFEFIFLKNFAAAAAAILTGVIFGVIPIFLIAMNGFILGIVSFIILKQFDIFVLMAGILPHGIIEIPAIIFSATGGLRIWRSFYRRILYDEKNINNEFLSVLKFFILIIIPMLIIAALIETFITPLAIDLTI